MIRLGPVAVLHKPTNQYKRLANTEKNKGLAFRGQKEVLEQDPEAEAERNTEAVIGQGKAVAASGCLLSCLENQLGAFCLSQKWSGL